MIRYSAGLLAFGACFVWLGAWFILPNEAEYAEMSFRDGLFETAHQRMSSLANKEPSHTESQFRLAQMQLYLGDVDAAMATLKTLVDSGETDPLILRTLAELNRSMGRMDAFLKLELAIPVAQLTADRRAELAGWLRYEGRHEAEREFLSQIEARSLASPAQRHRLAELLVSDHEREKAIEVFTALDEEGLLQDEPAKLTLLALLLESGRSDDAFVRAERWLSLPAGNSFRWNVQRIFEARGLDFEYDGVANTVGGD